MKMLLLAAVALATPAIAQNQPTTDSPQAPAQATTPQDAMPAQQSAPTDTNNAQQPPSNMEQPQPANDAAAMAPNGGYQPATPPLSGQPAPGQQVTFQAGKSPNEAYPAPAPLKSYPICKKGQTDKCRQRGG